MDECCMTVINQRDSDWALTPLSMTRMTSLTEILLLNFVTNLAFAFSHHTNRQNNIEWSSYSLMWNLTLSHGANDPCTCTYKLLWLTIWSLKPRKSWQVAKLVHELLLSEIWCQKIQFLYRLLLHCRSRYHFFVGIQFLLGDWLGRQYAGAKAYGLNRLRTRHGRWIGLHFGRKTCSTFVWLRLPQTQANLTTAWSRNPWVLKRYSRDIIKSLH